MGADECNVLKKIQIRRCEPSLLKRTPYDRVQNSACPLHSCAAEAKTTSNDAHANIKFKGIIITFRRICSLERDLGFLY